MPALLDPPDSCRAPDGSVSMCDLYYATDADQFVFIPTGDLWTAQAVNGRLPKIKDGRRNGKDKLVMPAEWARKHRAVEQRLWLPGAPQIVEDRLLSGGGWKDRPGAHALNLYRPPVIVPGDASQAGPYLDHLRRLYPDDADEFLDWSAHRVQRPGEKVNWSPVLGGNMGTGKDYLLQALKFAVGPWNFTEAKPNDIFSKNNRFAQAVVSRVSEAHDLGESGRADRFSLYDALKQYQATPPDVLMVSDKYIRAYPVANVVGLALTTNHLTDGIFLEPDDRRHFVMWSDVKRSEFEDDYWPNMWVWAEGGGGFAHVAAMLRQRDISGFQPGLPPRQTPAFHVIVHASTPPENTDLADAIDELGKAPLMQDFIVGTPPRPKAITVTLVRSTVSGAALEWMDRQKRAVPHRMAKVGYALVKYSFAADGYWIINGKRQAIYAHELLSSQEREQSAWKLYRKLNGGPEEKGNGNG